MARTSTVKKQKPEVRETIGSLHREGKTLDEILAALEDTYGVKLSRSALHRHVKGLEKVLARMERSRHIAEAAVKAFGHEPESKVARVGIELVHSAIVDIMSAGDADVDPDKEDGGARTPMDAMLLAKALEHLTKASRHDADLIAKIREQARKEAEVKMEAAAKTALAEAAGDSPLTAAAVFRRIQAIYRGEA